MLYRKKSLKNLCPNMCLRHTGLDVAQLTGSWRGPAACQFLSLSGLQPRYYLRNQLLKR